MNLLDIRTVVLNYALTDIICVWFVVLLWRQSRDRFAGTAFWVGDFVFQTAALILIVLRGAIPDWMSIVLSNTLVIAGAILGFMGLERFVGKKGPQIHNYLVLTLFVVVHGYFTLVQPSLAVRSLNISVALLLVCFQSLWLMWRRVEPGLRSLSFGVGAVFFLYCLVSLVRIGSFLIGTYAESNYFQSGLFEALVLLSYQVLFILLTYSFVLMVNKRLLMHIGTQEEKFTKAFHSAPYAITLSRLSDGTIIDVNEGFTAISGYGRSEVLGKKTMDLRLWENGEGRARVVDALSRTGKIHGVEIHFQKKNGETITGLYSAEIILIDGEKSVLSSIADITERKLAEESLARLNQQKRLLLNSAAEGILGLDVQGNHSFVNPAAARMLGYEVKELLGCPSHSTWHHTKPDGSPYPIAECQIRATYIDGGAHRVSTEVFWRKDGASFPVEYASTPIYEQGRLAGAVVTFTDIAERKRAEEEMRRSKEIAERLSRETAVIAEIGMVIGSTLDIDEVYGQFAAEAKKLIPFDRLVVNLHSPHEANVTVAFVAGRYFSDRRKGDLFPLKGSMTEALIKTRASQLNYPDNGELRRHNRDHPALIHESLCSQLRIPLIYRSEVIASLHFGSVTPNSYTEQDLRLAERIGAQIAGAIGSAKLFSELKQSEEKLASSIRELARSNVDLEQFAYVASHDLQEPLRMVSSFTQLLAKHYEGRLDEKATEFMGYIRDGAVRMQRLINDLLSYSRVGTRGMTVETTDTNVILGEAIRNLNAVIEEKHAIITNDELPTVQANKSQLVQVFQNLIANAVKFHGEDVPRIHVSAQDQGREWVFSIKDNGIGIDRQYADRLFIIFQRLHTRQEYPGTGIGLALCKRIVERHGDRIWFESEPGKGSTFFFTITK